MKATLLSVLISGFVFAGISPAFSQAQNPDQFYRPVKSKDLITKLPPRVDKEKLLSGNNGDFLSFDGNGGCPETVLIGSVDEDSDVFGSVDIDVVIENDIIIDCGGL